MLIIRLNDSELMDFLGSTKEWDIIIVGHETIESSKITSNKLKIYFNSRNDINLLASDKNAKDEELLLKINMNGSTITPCTHGLLSSTIPTYVFYICNKVVEYSNGLLFIKAKDLFDSIKTDFSSDESEYYLNNDFINISVSELASVKHKIFIMDVYGNVSCNFNSNHNFPIVVDASINKLYDYCREYVRYKENYIIYNCVFSDLVLIKNREILSGIQGGYDKKISDTIFLYGTL